MRFKALPVTSLEDVTLDLEQLQTIFHALTWAAPTLLNSWANLGSGFETAAYLKDPLGFVHIKGVIIGGATGTVAFVLPAGYRPGATTDGPLFGGSATGNYQIASNGNVTIVGTFASGVGLSGITFLGEN